MNTKHILLLEDAAKLSTLQSIFEKLNLPWQNLQIHPFHSPSAAISYIRKQLPLDLAVLSIEMNNLFPTGLDVAAELRRHSCYASTGIIFLSSLTHYSTLAFHRFHYYEFLPKPYTEMDLLRALGQYLHHPEYEIQVPRRRLLQIPILRTQNQLQINCDEVSCLEKNQRVLTIHYKNGTSVEHTITNGTFRNLRRSLMSKPSMEVLMAMPLVEIHCSIIVNIEAITEVSLARNRSNSPYVRVMGCDSLFPISKEHSRYFSTLFYE